MELRLLNLLILTDFCVILTLVCSLRACHIRLTGITCLFMKYGENLARSFFEILKYLPFNYGDFNF